MKKKDIPGFEKPCSGVESPLSFSQESLWFLENLSPGLPGNNTVHLFRLPGTLQLNIFQLSLDEMIKRHSTLRTLFRESGGTPVQVVLPEMEIKVELVNLPGTPVSEMENVSSSICRQEIHNSYDLTRGPLIRLKVLHFSKDKEFLLLAAHHIIFDAWSRRIFIRELFQIYAEKLGQKTEGLPPIKMSYQQYAVRQREWWNGPDADRLLSGWLAGLVDIPPFINYPTDFSRQGNQTYRGGGIEHILSEKTAGNLGEFCKSLHVTPFMVVLASYAAVLHQLSGQSEILVGCPFANRTNVDTESLIGAFINTLPILIHFDEGITFHDLILQVRESVFNAADGQSCPFEKIIEHLKPIRNLNRPYGYQVTFNLRNVPTLLATLDHQPIEEVYFLPDLVSHELELEARLENKSVILTLCYSQDIFEESTAGNILNRLVQTMNCCLEAPGEQLQNLLHPSPVDLEKVLIEWNNTDAPFHSTRTIHSLLEQKCLERPDQVAIMLAGQPLNYEDLNNEAEDWASILRAAGIGAGCLVGISLPQSFIRYIAIFAILKAGGAYLPLDPDLPTDRLAFMIKDSRVRLVLSTSEDALSLPRLPGIQIIIMNDHPDVALIHTGRKESTAADLAYVIYTSGTTGLPKGVAVTHRNVVNYIDFFKEELALTTSDRVLQFSTINFDASVEEIFSALFSGATLVLRTKDYLDSIPGFLEKCRDSEITVLNLPTAFWHELTSYLEQSEQNIPSSIRIVVVGGEQIQPHKAAGFLERLPPRTKLYNTYGPTETTVACAYYEIKPPACQWRQYRDVPIGTPVTNTRIYILDNQLEPVPPGVPGEIYIAGAGVAQGYLNQPDLTAEKFLPDPFNQPGEKMYRSGDFGYFKHDGNIIFIGRKDAQVKIRGFRIELGEIENALLQHPNIAQAVVITQTNQAGEKFLAAYLVSKNRLDASPAGMRDFLQEKISQYMLPSAYVFLDELPTSPNGKLDRSALPVPEAKAYPTRNKFTPARTSLERKLTQIWCDVLGVKQVGVDDNFFDLGGHSLLAVQLVSRIEKTIGAAISVQTLFNSPTISTLALSMQEGNGEQKPLAVFPMRNGIKSPPLFIIPAGARTVMSLHDLVLPLEIEHPVYGLEYTILHADGDSHVSVEEFARVMMAHVQQVQPHGPYYLAGKCYGGLLAFDMAKQLLAVGEKVDLVILIDSNPPASLNGTTLEAGKNNKSLMIRFKRILRDLRHGIWSFRVHLTDDVQTKVFKDVLTTRMQYFPTPYAGELILIQSEEMGLRQQKKWERFAARVRFFQVPGIGHKDLSTKQGKITVAQVVTRIIQEQDDNHQVF